MNSSLTSTSSTSLQDFIFRTKYSRYNASVGRRENWSEAVGRVRDMHLTRFQSHGSKVMSLIVEAMNAVQDQTVLCSMRSLQFAGPAIEKHEARMYNCSATHLSRIEAFREAFYLLLCGCGVGFSVQKPHVAKLPVFAPRSGETATFVVPDTIEGWADALHFLMENAVDGVASDFDFSQIRPKGMPLRTSGGKAPGAAPLQKALTQIDGVLRKAQGRRLRSIEAYDILMFAARAVLSGGVRRSATICLFSADDEEMMNAKTGDWLDVNPQRTASNNSAVLIRGTVTRAQFDRLFEAQKAFGEPGFFFADDADAATNPCCEISLYPVFIVRDRADLALAAKYGVTRDDDGGALRIGSRCSGFQFCNLTTINCGKIVTAENFYVACRRAAILGTLQAAYTRMPYLSPVSRLLNEREALLGVSLCGIFDNPAVMLDPEVLRKGAEIVKATNAEVAALIGINPAARTTCVKPEGTTSLLLGTGSGIHPHHDEKIIRHVQMNRLDPIFQHFKKFNPHMVEPSVYSETDECIMFPVQIPPTAKTRHDFTAIEFLSAVIQVQLCWVETGTAHKKYSKGVHNVSNTVPVKPDEWQDVADFLWKHRGNITGVSMLSADGDKVYPQAPRYSVVTAEDEKKFVALIPNAVDWDALVEKTDETAVRLTAACAGGACELQAV